jgi:hypothetical protein
MLMSRKIKRKEKRRGKKRKEDTKKKKKEKKKRKEKGRRGKKGKTRIRLHCSVRRFLRFSTRGSSCALVLL